MTSKFSALLSKPAEAFEAPKPLPPGTYQFVIKEFKFGESAKKKTPFVQYLLTPMQAESDVDQDQLHEYGSISARNFNVDYYLTEEALYRLSEFHEKLGHNTKLSLDELIPMAVNKIVRGVISHSLSQDGKTTYANISDILGVVE